MIICTSTFRATATLMAVSTVTPSNEESAVGDCACIVSAALVTVVVTLEEAVGTVAVACTAILPALSVRTRMHAGRKQLKATRICCSRPSRWAVVKDSTDPCIANVSVNTVA